MMQAVCVLMYNFDCKGETDLYLGVSRKDNANDFGLPGGKVEPNESLEQAAKRELKEETGFNAHRLRLIFTEVCYGKDGQHYETHTFICEAFTGAMQSNEAGVVKWVTRQELLDGSFGLYNKKLFDSIDGLDS